MPELLIELLTEEIPARMQARAAEDFCRLIKPALAPLLQGEPRAFYGPRRIGLVGEMALSAETAAKEERGPRIGAPEQARAGFLKKHNATAEMLVEQSGFLVLVKPGETITAEALLHLKLPELLWAFPWPKSMRWGMSQFTWVRPLQRILCLLDGSVVPVSLARGEDDAHGLVAADVTEGHRVHAPGAFPVTGYADYVARLRADCVIVDAGERMALVRDGVAALAAAQGLDVVPDEGLLAEVAGLVEWPVPLLGRIDDAFMDLPPEVMRTSMRVNQRYFALRYPDGRAAPFFALVANISASDGGAALVAGNERVLRARLSDARFFWDQDRKQKLAEFLPKLEGVVFHAKLGTQRQRVDRIAKLAAYLAPMVGVDPSDAELGGRLAKADLAAGMVGEFPELQGVMGGYYASFEQKTKHLSEAIAQHYKPLGPNDSLPSNPIAIAIALADKLDQITGFFGINERPTGSADPFAIRRAALGLIRIILDQNQEIDLFGCLEIAQLGYHNNISVEFLRECDLSKRGLREFGFAVHFPSNLMLDIIIFLIDRLKIQLRDSGLRPDVIAAVSSGLVDWNLLGLRRRAVALDGVLAQRTGVEMMAGYRRASGILRSEKWQEVATTDDEDYAPAPGPEADLDRALRQFIPASRVAMDESRYEHAFREMARLSPVIDSFFQATLVNDPDPSLRRNRLRLLSRLRTAMDQVADLSKIES